MTIQAGITTIIGGFLLPFALRLFWDKFVHKLGAIGGWLAAFIIVGTIWILNHGIKFHLIYQSGTVWFDMGWAAGIGIFVSTAVAGGNIKKALPTLISAILGGILGAIIVIMLI